MNILKEIGIQQWRLREPLLSEEQQDLGASGDAPQATEDQSVPQVARENAIQETPPQLMSWDALQDWLDKGNCDSCRQGGALLGEGSRQADWLFLVDAPNTEALKQSSVIGGRARSLYQSILLALDLSLESVYTTGVFKCAPSEDAMLTTACQEILNYQIELLDPKIIICLGEFSGQTLVKSNDGLQALREQQLQCLHSNVPVVVSHSLADLLQTPVLKAQAWRDFKIAMHAVSNTPL